MTQVISVSNQKGGVGKTTITVSLAWGLVRKGYKVLVIDNDQQANTTMALMDNDQIMESILYMSPAQVAEPSQSNTYLLYQGASGKPAEVANNLFLYGSSSHLAKIDNDMVAMYGFLDSIEDVKESFDYVLIDCPPSLGIHQMAALNAADHILIPTDLERFSIEGIRYLEKTVRSIRRQRPELRILGIVANGVSATKVLVEEHFMNDLKNDFGSLLMSTTITKSKNVKESQALGQSIFEAHPGTKQSDEFERLTDEVIQRIEG